MTRVGTGLRREAWAEIEANLDEFDVFEVTADHYVHGSARARERFEDMAARKPIVAHGVGLSIGTAVAPDPEYLDAVAAFVDAVGAPWYSEHLAFTGVPGCDVAELLPLPRTPATVEIVCENVAAVRRRVPVPFLLENISYYFSYPGDEMSEADFVCAVLAESGSRLLLDLENLHVNATNHGYDPVGFLDALPPGVVGGVHLAGGTRAGDLLIDSHNRPVADAVFDLLARVLERQDPDTVIVERDEDFGAFDTVVADCRRARAALP